VLYKPPPDWKGLMLLQNGQNPSCQPGKHSTTLPCMAEQDLLQKQDKYITSCDGKNVGN
jgi:hypothetical protein